MSILVVMGLAPYCKKLTSLLLLSLLGLCLAAQTESNYTKIDRHAQRAPKKWQENLPKLTDYLLEKTDNEFEKVRVIYSWITLNISYDDQAIAQDEGRINKNIRDILVRRKAICMGYAALFKEMCALANIEAAVVDGYSKGTATSVPNLSEPDHSWNAVFIDSQWYLLDATWGSSLIQKNAAFTTINEDYYLSPPDQFILTHLPSAPMWQLLECPITPATYKEDQGTIGTAMASCPKQYHFKDTLQQFFALSKAKQRLDLSQKAYQFNPTASNQKEFGHALMDFAGVLSDSVDVLQANNQLTLLIAMQEKIILLSEKAAILTPLHNWQIELYAGTLINQVVARFQQNQALDQPITSVWNDLIQELEKVESVLQNVDDSFFKQMASKQCLEYINILKDYAR